MKLQIIFGLLLIIMQPITGFNFFDVKQKEYSAGSVTYPVRLAYVDRINQWWPPEKIAGGIGVPGYADQTIYNFIALAFWSYGAGPLDIVNIWAEPLKYFGT